MRKDRAREIETLKTGSAREDRNHPNDRRDVLFAGDVHARIAFDAAA
jgi:hypothetical protein